MHLLHIINLQIVQLSKTWNESFEMKHYSIFRSIRDICAKDFKDSRIHNGFSAKESKIY